MKIILPAWQFNGIDYNPDVTELKKYSGFVYIIHNYKTGMHYIGKKNFWSIKKLKPTDKRRTTVQSDWQNYLGSNKDFAATCKGDIEFVMREIVYLCRTKYAMSYNEMRLQFRYDVLHPDSRFSNDNISGKYFKSKYHEWLSPSETSTQFTDNYRFANP